ncbi:MAG: hypothetical protein KTR24_15170 [Saprospiraceae bacterium]|nr:hypothetical protein [Saprospiraceae bacterium]
MRISGLSVIVLLGMLGCIKAPEYPDEPELTYEGLSSNRMIQSDLNLDSTILFLSFTDGDGDVGTDTEVNLFVTDTRDDFVAARYRLPFIPVAGSNNGVSGDIQLVLFTTCCTYPNGQAPCTPSEEFPSDTVIYEIYMMDRAGNISNKVLTDPIILDCR